MAGDRETTFILKAADLSSQPISQVISTVQRLTEAQVKNNQAASEGSIKQAAFKDSVVNLQGSVKALGDQLGVLANFEGTANKAAAGLDRVAAARAKIDTFKATIGDGAATPDQEEKLKKLEAALVRTQNAARNAQENYSIAVRTLERYGVASDEVAGAQDRIRAALAGTAEVLQRAGREQIEFSANQERAAAATRVQAEAERELQESRRQAAAVDRIALESNRALDNQRRAAAVEAERIAQREVEASLKSLDAQRSRAEAENRANADALAASRNKVQAAVSSVPATASPVGDPSLAPNLNQTAEAISALTTPALAARQTLQGVQEGVTALSKSLADGKLSQQDYAKIVRALTADIQALKEKADLVDTFNAQKGALAGVTSTLDTERSKLTTLVDTYQRKNVVDKQQESQIVAQAALVRQLTAQFNSQTAALNETTVALHRAGLDTNNLAEDTQRLANVAKETGAAIKTAQSGAEGRAPGAFSLFGLNRYELTNLSYQVNDVITQISSGTSIAQTAAQQGGQIFQIFQKNVAEALGKVREIPGAFTAIGVAAAVLVVSIAAVARGLEVAAAKRALLTTLETQGGTNNTAAGLLAAADAARRYGVALTDATKSAGEFVKAGFNDQQVASYLAIAGQLSKTQNVPIAKATTDVTSLFNAKNIEDVRKFTNEYARLTSGQDDLIRTLLEANKAAEAQDAIFSAVAPKIGTAYTKSTTEAGESFRKLRTNIDAFLDRVGEGFLNAAAPVASFFALIVKGLDNYILGLDRAEVKLSNFLRRQVGLSERELPLLPGQTAPFTGADATDARNDPNAPRNLRNNNPGNLQFANQPGATRENGSGRFASFPNLETGVSAQLSQILLDNSRGLKSIEQLVMKYTPPRSKGGDNDDAVVEKYINAVAKELNVSRNQPLNFNDPAVARAYISAVSAQEGGERGRANAGAIDRGVAQRLGTNPSTNQNLADRQQTANTDFARTEDKSILRNAGALGNEEAKYQAFVQTLRDSDDEIKKRADKAAQDNGVRAIDQTELERVQAAARSELLRKYLDEKAAREREALATSNELRNRELEADKTNLDNRLKANDNFYDEKLAAAQKQNTSGLFPTQDGTTFQDLAGQIEKARQDEANRIRVDAAKAITDESRKQFDLEVQRLNALKDANKITLEQLQTGLRDVVTSEAPKIRAAVTRSNAALANVPDSDAVRTQRVANETTLAGLDRPRAAADALQRGTDDTQRQFEDLTKERDAAFAKIVNDLKSGAVTLTQGLSQAADVTTRLGPRIKSASDATNNALRSVANDPLSNAGDRARIQGEIAKNEQAASNADQLRQIIEEGVKADKDRFDALQKERDVQIKELNRTVQNGSIAQLEGLNAINAKYNPQIKDAGARLAASIKAAIAAPGVGVGQRAELGATLVDTEQKSDTRNQEIDSTRSGVNVNLKKLDDLRASIKETEQAQKQLVSLNVTSTDEAESKIAKSYEEANTEAAKIIPTIRAQIAQLEALGASSTEIDKLKAKVDAFSATTKYTSQFQKELGQTIENSFASRGLQALEQMGQSLGNLIAGTGTLKDVFKTAGQAFAQFAAGFLEDIAKMIIKALLFKAIQAGLSAAGLPTIPVGVGHAGLTAGSPGGTVRNVDMSVFQFARRYHTGGPVGLAPDEVPAILQQGEVVLSKSQLRQQQSGGGNNGGGGTAVRNVLAVGDDEIAKALNGSHGEQVIINTLRRNAPTVRKLIG